MTVEGGELRHAVEVLSVSAYVIIHAIFHWALVVGIYPVPTLAYGFGVKHLLAPSVENG